MNMNDETKDKQVRHTVGECFVDPVDRSIRIHCDTKENIVVRYVMVQPHDYDRRREECQANAARLALCWNCHDELVTACKYALARLEHGPGEKNPNDALPDELRAILRKAQPHA